MDRLNFRGLGIHYVYYVNIHGMSFLSVLNFCAVSCVDREVSGD